ncbi:MAG: 1-deoxy-D-xylulose-5-phosphate reductoisomerase [Sphaerochaeta sp.]|jgi:1-deoxy-D-xylulose-5-phosphate reductoisomerase|nr:1-deoxy-D-xylulose-5-phosphate reductoisomerase [Sphaerochaeta sp.]MCH3920872.1 1-deoxy-D-xylulose-5-phosphate reductoisomerase [Sphaerochaeta sp.]MCI2045232.1 1-deoxy-D-xylulose-5-phosphate reductoisomerase [Sphaerochaeta sp.]MCI2076680.1 1-deoxy-D-xylulose-5-phosphate reductoisomerase [Sphaerochaeta sp.]MCI2096713.1 1-deoxy-D-xylulose-5-phosphate reductoisomerase [Sphaerochaeta sp.]
MKDVIILGATGSIGTTALNAIRTHHLPLHVVGLSCHTQKDRLQDLGPEFPDAKRCLTGGKWTEGYSGFPGLRQMLQETKADIVLNGISGFDGLPASVYALEAGKDLALANKESVVCGWSFLFDLAKKHHCAIIPVDSEHSAIYQLLNGQHPEEVDTLVITASGGPFRTWSEEQMHHVTVQDALNHPTWKMGKKITIDSATLANKGMEVIEASKLFGFPPQKIEVVVHPQSIVHSMIRMKSGAVYAQLGMPDMSLPIISALLPGTTAPLVSPLDFSHLSLTFEAPDFKRFPLLELTYHVLEQGGAASLAFNAADEVAVSAFLSGKIAFSDITDIVETTVAHADAQAPRDLSEAVSLNKRYRSFAGGFPCACFS